MSTGGKGGGKVKIPDPQKIADAQASMNDRTAVTQALLNQVNQSTPWGSLTYSPLPGAQKDSLGRPMQYQADVSLSPNQQRLLDLQETGQIGLGEAATGMIPQLADLYGKGLDFGQFGDVPGMGEQGRSALEDALFARLEPSIERDRSRLETRLANQGIAQGSEAYSGAMDDFGRGVNDARLAVATQAGAEQNRQMQARQQAINELLTQRSVPLNEIQALMGGSQVSQPQFVNTPQTGVPSTDVAGNYWNALQAGLARQQQAGQGMSDLMGGLFGLGGNLGSAAILASDRRLKRDIVRIGTGALGLPLYAFRYLWSRRRSVGYMADEVREVAPWAVVPVGGYDFVDYGALA